MAGRKNADDPLILALASGVTVHKAAEQCKVGERTVYRRLQDPDFRRRLSEARGTMLHQAIGHLAKGAAGAAIVLRRLLRSKKDGVKLSAAKLILETGARLRDTLEYEERLREVEARLAKLHA